MKQLVITSFIVVLIFISCGSRNKNNDSTALAFNQVISMSAEYAASKTNDAIDLGTVKQGEVIEYRLGMINADTIPMVVLGVIKGCGCSAIEYDNDPTMPGDTLAFTLKYNTAGQTGSQIKAFQVITSLYERYHNIYIYANVVKE